jgi:hypothetical protein
MCYHESLNHYTVAPILRFLEVQQDLDEVKELLPLFKERKEHELAFVKTAVGALART